MDTMNHEQQIAAVIKSAKQLNKVGCITENHKEDKFLKAFRAALPNHTIESHVLSPKTKAIILKRKTQVDPSAN